MSLLSVAEVRALVTTSLSDSDLGDVIDREESWLAQRIGPLSGERTETFATEDGDEVLRLTRHTASVSIEDDNGTYSGASLRGWSDIVPDTSTAWSGNVLVTHTPDDSSSVEKAVITLVRLAIAESGFQSEAAGGYSAIVDPIAQKDMRYTAWRSLLRPSIPATTRLTSTVPSGGRTVGAVKVEATGS